jgi:mycothiol system anti-sigma-R factor
MADHHDHDHASRCEEALAELYTFLDGELTEDRRGFIRQHLDDCNPCLEAFDFEAELRLVIKRRCTEEVPESLRDRVAEQLAEMSRLAQPSSPQTTLGGPGGALAGPDARA